MASRPFSDLEALSCPAQSDFRPSDPYLPRPRQRPHFPRKASDRERRTLVREHRRGASCRVNRRIVRGNRQTQPLSSGCSAASCVVIVNDMDQADLARLGHRVITHPRISSPTKRSNRHNRAADFSGERFGLPIGRVLAPGEIVLYVCHGTDSMRLAQEVYTRNVVRA